MFGIWYLVCFLNEIFRFNGRENLLYSLSIQILCQRFVLSVVCLGLFTQSYIVALLCYGFCVLLGGCNDL